MASGFTLSLRAVKTREERSKAEWAEKTRQFRSSDGPKAQAGKRHGPLGIKKQGTSSRRARREALKTLPRSLRRHDGAALYIRSAP